MAPPGKLTFTDTVPLNPQLLKEVRDAAKIRQLKHIINLCVTEWPGQGKYVTYYIQDLFWTSMEIQCTYERLKH